MLFSSFLWFLGTLILLVLVVKGVGGLTPAVFTEMTPPPGGVGGLLNPIIGSLIITILAVLIGTPLGMLAGTYMAEYGRYSKLTMVVRFINDILLSAPSIVVGLFVYEIMVAQMGHFSAWAGAVALALIVSVLIGILLLGSPLTTALAVSFVFGILLLIEGIALIVFAFRVKG